MNHYLIKKLVEMDIFSSFGEIQKLKMHIFKMFWDTIGYTENHKDLS
jgi:hypothetical protein